jgi:hypothetical protein
MVIQTSVMAPCRQQQRPWGPDGYLGKKRLACNIIILMETINDTYTHA